jgi:tetratricopeptide (TPR) repeat protein
VRFLNQYQNEDYHAALDTIRSAQQVDPWLELYDLEEAITLGQLAADDPDTYLADSIRAFEHSVDLIPVWAVGWHNLAALYAQAGDYTRAIEAESEARQLDPLMLDYALKMGEYEERAGHWSAAEITYIQLLEDWPWFAASSFWTTPERAALLDRMLNKSELTTLEAVERLAYAGRTDRPAITTLDRDIQDSLRTLWPDDSSRPCLYCYYVKDNPDLLEAERLMHQGSLTSQQRERVKGLAQKALFLSGYRGAWGWYILARLEDQENIEQVRTYLLRAVELPVDYRITFPGIYKMMGEVPVLPQARAPMLPPVGYEPWLKLLELQQQAGLTDDAQDTLELLQQVDPYAEFLP